MVLDESIGTTAETRGTVRSGVVAAVSRDEGHNFTKPNVDEIELVAGFGVKGDSHWGETVQHLVRVREDPTRPNRRQIHLIHGELHDELRGAGYAVEPGQMGENVTTRGVDLLGLPTGARLRIGDEAVVEITGLRNPCKQLDRFQPGLMRAVLDRAAQGNLVRKSGVMGVVLAEGEIKAGDAIQIELPPTPHRPLERV